MSGMSPWARSRLYQMLTGRCYCGYPLDHDGPCADYEDQGVA